MDYELRHFATPDNPRKDEVIEFMMAHNAEFAQIEMSLVEVANDVLAGDDDETLTGRAAIERYYDELCDELIVVLDGDEVVACRFVDHREDDEYFRSRVDDYEPGLNLPFALVAPAHRREGLWTRMLDRVEQDVLPRYDVDRLYLATASTNDPMQAAAEGAGFERLAVDPDDRGEGVDTYIYVKTV